jgi:glyoxylase-like metal-dependent hydrolase (beta-lactamase superfamily II)
MNNEGEIAGNRNPTADSDFRMNSQMTDNRKPTIDHRPPTTFRLELGDFELTVLSDGHYFLDGGAVFGVVPRPLWERKIAADERHRIEMGLNSLLVRDGKRTVLIETGIGPKLPEKARQIFSHEARLLESMAQAGVAPEEVDVVINTHLHFDHCGWNTRRENGRLVPTFPRARYCVQRGEWEAAQHPNERDYVSYLAENYAPLVESGQMELISGDAAIAPGISVRVYPGHTRHMQAVLLRSGGRTACYISDLIPTAHHLEIAWGMAFDLFPVETMEQKKRFYAEAISNRWLVVFTHGCEIPWAYVERNPAGKLVARPVGANDRRDVDATRTAGESSPQIQTDCKRISADFTSS